jgi:hypothetical protein
MQRRWPARKILNHGNLRNKRFHELQRRYAMQGLIRFLRDCFCIRGIDGGSGGEDLDPGLL